MTRSVADGGNHGMTSRGRLWLTDDEERELRERLHELMRDPPRPHEP